jgi:4-hydroxybenzoate polyprenyltransferase
LGTFYWGGVVIVAALLAYEHWLVRPDDLDRVNLAFFHVNWIVSVLLLVVGTADLLI